MHQQIIADLFVLSLLRKVGNSTEKQHGKAVLTVTVSKPIADSDSEALDHLNFQF